MMTDGEESTIVRVELREASDIIELVIAFRRNDELHELASVSPPAVAELKKLDSTIGLDEPK